MFSLSSAVRPTSARARRASGTRATFAPIWDRPAPRRSRTRVHPALRLVETGDGAPLRRAA